MAKTYIAARQVVFDLLFGLSIAIFIASHSNIFFRSFFRFSFEKKFSYTKLSFVGLVVESGIGSGSGLGGFSLD